MHQTSFVFHRNFAGPCHQSNILQSLIQGVGDFRSPPLKSFANLRRSVSCCVPVVQMKVQTEYKDFTSFQKRMHMPTANKRDPMMAVSQDSLNCSETEPGTSTGASACHSTCSPLSFCISLPPAARPAASFTRRAWPFYFQQFIIFKKLWHIHARIYFSNDVILRFHEKKIISNLYVRWDGTFFARIKSLLQNSLLLCNFGSWTNDQIAL